MDATTLAEIKTWLNESSADLDNQLAQLIGSVSQRLERPDLLNMPLQELARVEEYQCIRSRTKRITLRGAPVDTAQTFEIKESYNKDWANTIAMVASDYNVFGAADEGFVAFHSPVFGPTVMQISYTYGLAATTAALITAYPAISQAAVIWIAEIYSRRKSIGKTVRSYPNQGGTVTFELGDPPKIVKNMLEAFQRRSMVA